jgi:hypothetical protein
MTTPAITASRHALEDLLEAAGLPVVKGAGKLMGAPTVGVYAGDPWLDPLPSLGPPVRRARWVVRMVGGQVDQAGTLDQLADMMAAAVTAIQAARLEVVDNRVTGPRTLGLDNGSYLAADLVVRTIVDLSAPPVGRELRPDPAGSGAIAAPLEPTPMEDPD